MAEVLTSFHAGVERSPAERPTDPGGEREDDRRDAVPVVPRVRPASGSGPRRVRRKMECVYNSVTASACVLSTAVHSGSFGERTYARARALHNNRIAELLRRRDVFVCDITIL